MATKYLSQIQQQKNQAKKKWKPFHDQTTTICQKKINFPYNIR